MRCVVVVAVAALSLGAAEVPDPSVGASTRVTSHAQHTPIDRSELSYSGEAEIKEFHFHTYFHLFQHAQSGDIRSGPEQGRSWGGEAIVKKHRV